MLSMGRQLDLSLLGYIFLGTITGYNFIKYSFVAKFHHFSLKRNLRLIQLFSLVCFGAFIYSALNQPIIILKASAVLGLVTLLYVVPVLPNKNNLRSVTGLKVFVIAFVWAGVTVILPVLIHDVVYIYSTAITFLQRFVFAMTIALPFDVLDMRIDQPGLGTIPQLYGVETTRTACVVLLTLTVILEVFKIQIDTAEIGVLLVIVAVTYYLLHRSTEEQSRYFSAFWIDGIPILWFILLFIAKKWF